MKKLSKREIVLLGILIFFLLGYGFYKFLYIPQKSAIEELENKKIEVKQKLSEVNNEIKKEKRYKETLIKKNKEIEKISELFYLDLNQEDFIVLLNSINRFSSFRISSFSFSDNSLKSLDQNNNNNGKMSYYEVKLNYSGLYEELYNYVEAVQSQKKYIYINDININTNANGFVRGEMTIKFPNLPFLSEKVNQLSYFEKNGELVKKQNTNPYIPYASLAEKLRSDDEDELNQIEIYLEDRLVFPIIGFDTSKPFFVGSDVDVTAEIGKSLKRLYGKYSHSFAYDFGVKKPFAEANFVFDKELIINEQKDFISLWVYSEEVTGHMIGISLADSEGNYHNVELTPNVDWKGWKILEADLPIEVNYPARVQRIYTSSTDYDQKLNGKLLFDQMQLADEKELNN